MCLLQTHIEELDPGTVTTRQQTPKLRHFIDFVAFRYAPWWMMCSVPVNTPRNDFNLYKNFLRYGKVHKDVSKSAKKALSRHLWYLTSEMVPLGIFCDFVPDAEKSQMAQNYVK